jgi:hypothetical protein
MRRYRMSADIGKRPATDGLESGLAQWPIGPARPGMRLRMPRSRAVLHFQSPLIKPGVPFFSTRVPWSLTWLRAIRAAPTLDAGQPGFERGGSLWFF